jgi:hypothetical protein
MIREAEESMQWRAREKERERRVQDGGAEHHMSPGMEGRQIRNAHYGQTMAGLLSF